jgi:TolB-like protein/Tfp pilus assembly protein PilF
MKKSSGPTGGVAVVSPREVRQHLAVVLSSAEFAGATRLRGLLAFLVEEALGGRGTDLKEARIGLEVFGRRPDSYDPAIDPIVRVQAGRLRNKLARFYDAHPGSPLRIEIPLGTYSPRFEIAALATLGSPAMEAATARPAVRVAVLPIVNMSPDAGHQYFCDGLTEELGHVLARLPGVRVVARTSSFQFRGAERDVREVGRLLDVSSVLEGSARWAGDRVRVTVQLIDAADGCHRWSERYEGDLTDIFGIQEQIARAVEEALRQHALTLAPAPAVPSTRVSVEAYNHYLQGRFLFKRRTEQGLRAALEHFEAAAQQDPSFARALSGIADCHLMLGMSAAAAPSACMPLARASADAALAIDGSLAEAHASRAAIQNCYVWNFAAAEAGYQQALALDPGYASALHWLAIWTRAPLGDFQRAHDDLEHAIELDPLSPPIIADLALVHAFEGHVDAASMYCRRALELDPHFHRPYWFLGLLYAWAGDHQRAIDALVSGLERCPGLAFRSRLLGALGYAYGRAGHSDSARQVIKELEHLRGTSYVPSFERAQVEVGAGNLPGALSCLEDAVLHRETYAIFIGCWRTFEPLRTEPRFRALLSQVGLA